MTAPPPAPPPPPTPWSGRGTEPAGVRGAAAAVRDLTSQLCAMLPFRSPLLVGCALVVVAALLGIPFGGDPGWWFLVPLLAAAVAVAADVLQTASVVRITARPVDSRVREAIAGVLLVLTAAIAVLMFRFALVPILWVLALVFVVWGVCTVGTEASVLPARARLLRGYGAVTLAGGVLAVVAMLIQWGYSAESLGLGVGYGCDFDGCGMGFGYGTTLVGGLPYDGRSVQYGDWACLALALLLVLTLVRPVTLPAWLRRFGPAIAAAGLTLWFIVDLFADALLNGGSRTFGFYLFIVALVLLDLGAVLHAFGIETGRYAPATLAARVRTGRTPPSTTATSPFPPPPPPPPTQRGPSPGGPNFDE